MSTFVYLTAPHPHSTQVTPTQVIQIVIYQCVVRAIQKADASLVACHESLFRGSRDLYCTSKEIVEERANNQAFQKPTSHACTHPSVSRPRGKRP